MSDLLFWPGYGIIQKIVAERNMDVIKKIADGENITTEFKECRNRLPKNLFETICAFLNRMGGDIFLGVADDGAIIGVEESCVPQLKKI